MRKKCKVCGGEMHADSMPDMHRICAEAFAAPLGSAARVERIAGGTCDVCGHAVDALTAIYAAPVAGVCVCDDCLKPPNAAHLPNAPHEPRGAKT